MPESGLTAKPKLFLRTDGNPQIGMGHLIRCTSLAYMLKEAFDICFLVKDTSLQLCNTFLTGFEILNLKAGNVREEIIEIGNTINAGNSVLVLDGYAFDSGYQKECRTLNTKLVYIDDLMSFDYHCDVLINQADFIEPQNYRTDKNTVLCLGPEFALLRPAFLNAAKQQRTITTISKAFVSFGGADADNITYKVLQLISRIENINEIHILSGPVNETIDSWRSEFAGSKKLHFYSGLQAEEVATLMNACDIAFCPASSLSLELCAVGCLMITGITADNQKGYYKGLIKSGAALGIDDWKTASDTDIETTVRSVINFNTEQSQRMLTAQRNYIDGLSGERLKSVFLELI